jgi:hypothetical protein
MLDAIREADRKRRLLICAAMLRDVREMHVEVKTWPSAEQEIIQRITRQLQDLDERIHEVFMELAPAAEH